MKRIVRSEDERYAAGLRGGIAKAMDIDPALIRMILVFLTVVSGLLQGIVTYLFGWAVTPMVQAKAPWARLLPKRARSGIPSDDRKTVAPEDSVSPAE